MDIFTIKGITDELNLNATGAVVKKIFHKDNEIYFKLFGEKEKRNLYINISPSSQKIFLTNKKFSFMEKPTSFCMLLRKHLQNKRIVNFKIPIFYRIMEIDFNDRKLIIKFTGRSSGYIICDDNYNIIYSLKNGKLNQIFQYPEINFPKNFEEFKNCNFKIEGLPPFALKELKFIAEKYGIEKAWEYFKKLINFDLHLSPCKIEDKIYPYKPVFAENHKNIKYFSSFNELFDFEPELKKNLEKFLKDKIKKIKKTVEKLELELEQAKNYKIYEKYGELIKANLNCKTFNNNFIEIFDFYENKKIKIPIDSKISLTENMKNYFDKSKKLKRAIEKLQTRIAQLKAELQYFEDMLFYLEETEDLATIKEIAIELGYIKEKTKIINIKLTPYEKIKLNGITVYIGKSAKGNDLILRKFAKPDFVWCHAREVPGAHVLICEKMKNLSETVIKKACELALKNSKAKNNLKGDVIFTEVKYLKKTPNAPPGLVLVQKENVLHIKLENNNFQFKI